MNEETLFDLIVNAQESERDALLDQHCARNPQLRSRMENLLNAYSSGKSAGIDPTELHEVLASDPKLDPTGATQETTRNDAGTVLGEKYKLREQIGEGGMGAVWLATQSIPVKRKVAVKLIKAGMDSRQVVSRFEAERQALAMMDHPNIAKVFDGGMTDQGRPYFVMEYVKGIPLTDYCDQARLSVVQRLELFMPICQAIQHAHQKGIVHRDLKPSNILVCLYDGKPVCKVIDFGLAKAMHQPLTEHSVYTSHGVMVGTPLYMSPEQAEYNNLDVDTRTDIYSLGVVLYELLTGTTPLEREELRRAAYDEVLRLIKEVEPPRPSIRLSHSDSLPSIAAQRSIEPRHLGRSLSGDLDWIVMKSLEKDRSRRYETAAGLARDVERFLNEEAIEARPPSSTYRLGKYLKKHKLQATTFVTVLFAIFVGTSAAGWGWFKAIESEQKVRSSLVRETEQRVIAERALREEAVQRDRAESLLVKGILRPIGFGGEPEEQALLDWAQLPSDRLKLRALEDALATPASAIRLVKPRQGVLQACVGLSLDRRRRALDLLRATKLRRPRDHSTRLCTTMLAMELGEFDSEIAHDAIQLMSDPQTLRNWHAESLAELIISQKERSTDKQMDDILETFVSALEENEMTEAEISRKRAGLYQYRYNNLLDGPDRGPVSQSLRSRYLHHVAQNVADVHYLIHLVEQGLEPDSQWESLSVAERNSTMKSLQEIQVEYRYAEDCMTWSEFVPVKKALGELAAYANEAQMRDLWELIVEQMDFDKTSWSAEELRPIAIRATNDQLERLLGLLLEKVSVGIADSSEFDFHFLDDFAVIELLVSCLDTERNQEFVQQLRNDAPEVIAKKILLYPALLPNISRDMKYELLEKLLNVEEEVQSKQTLLVLWLKSLGRTISRGNEDQVENAWHALNNVRSAEEIAEVFAIAYSYQLNPKEDAISAVMPIRSIVAQLTESQFDQAVEDWETRLRKNSRTMGDRLLDVLSIYALIDRLTDEQLSKLWDENWDSLLRDFAYVESEEYWGFGSWALELINDRLTPEQREPLCHYIRKRLTDPEFVDELKVPKSTILYISKSLSLSQLDEIAKLALPVLADNTIDQSLKKECVSFLLPVIDRLPEPRVRDHAPRLLGSSSIDIHVALASRIPMKQHEALSTRMMDQIVANGDYCGRLPEVLYDAEQIAVWLMAPKCVGGLRERLLSRFEELVLHGERNLSTDDARRVNEGRAESPARQFLTTYAAAKWIDANWPDFDLDRPSTMTTTDSEMR